MAPVSESGGGGRREASGSPFSGAPGASCKAGASAQLGGGPWPGDCVPGRPSGRGPAFPEARGPTWVPIPSRTPGAFLEDPGRSPFPAEAGFTAAGGAAAASFPGSPFPGTLGSAFSEGAVRPAREIPADPRPLGAPRPEYTGSRFPEGSGLVLSKGEAVELPREVGFIFRGASVAGGTGSALPSAAGASEEAGVPSFSLAVSGLAAGVGALCGLRLLAPTSHSPEDTGSRAPRASGSLMEGPGAPVPIEPASGFPEGGAGAPPSASAGWGAVGVPGPVLAEVEGSGSDAGAGPSPCGEASSPFSAFLGCSFLGDPVSKLPGLPFSSFLGVPGLRGPQAAGPPWPGPGLSGWLGVAGSPFPAGAESAGFPASFSGFLRSGSENLAGFSDRLAAVVPEIGVSWSPGVPWAATSGEGVQGAAGQVRLPAGPSAQGAPCPALRGLPPLASMAGLGAGLRLERAGLAVSLQESRKSLMARPPSFGQQRAAAWGSGAQKLFPGCWSQAGTSVLPVSSQSCIPGV